MICMIDYCLEVELLEVDFSLRTFGTESQNFKWSTRNAGWVDFELIQIDTVTTKDFF